MPEKHFLLVTYYYSVPYADTNELAAADVLVFIREAIQRFPDSELRDLILSKLLEVFPSIKAVKIFRAALWILGEYCESQDLIQSVMHQVREDLFYGLFALLVLT